MEKLVLFLVIAIAILGVNADIFDPHYCYSNDNFRPQKGIMGVFTPYNFVRGENINSKVSNCTPTKFWLFARHGSKLPKPDEAKRIFALKDKIRSEIEKTYKTGKTTLCAADYNMIKDWTLNKLISPSSNQELTQSGEDEMESLAKRLRLAFPTILPKKYNKSHYYFRSSIDQRVKDSLTYFLHGLNDNFFVDIEPAPAVDFFMKPHENCPLYNELVKDIPEPRNFMNSTEFSNFLEAVSRKLAFEKQITLEELDAIMLICKYELLITPNKHSAFCSVFSIGDFVTYEYYAELEIYYKFGYGFKEKRTLFENLNCHLMQDLLKHMMIKSGKQKARIFVGNTATLISLFVSLGLFEDEVPLTSENFAEQKTRKWRSSAISPMASNLAVIRFDCADKGDDLLFLVNEKPAHLKGIKSCTKNGLCKLSEVVNAFGRFVSATCHEVFCSNSQ